VARVTIRILTGDCLEAMAFLPSGSVHTCVTSPPYFGLRDYGHDGQIGLEPTPDAFVAKLVEVFREVRRVLRDDGTLWLNLGDSYSRSPAKGGSGPNGKNEDRWGYGVAQSARVGSSDGEVGRADRPGSRSGGLGEKQLLGIPWRVAFALQQDGWYLRQDIIWHKPNPMPESVRDRCTKAHEYIFLLSKSPKYYYDAVAVAEKSKTNDPRRPYGSPGANAPDPRGKQGAGKPRGKTWEERKAMGFRGDTKHPTKDAIEAGLAIPSFATAKWGRNRRSVWTVTTKPFKGAHFATFPPDLIEPCVLAGSPEGGTVLDPFGGAGTTGLVANKHNRDAILCELNPAYAEMARNRIGPAARIL
jgi:DNA modification methylase